MASIYGGASGNGWKLRLDYTVTQDRAANTSSLRLRLYLYANTTGSYNLEKDSAYYVLQGQKVYQTYQYTAPGWYLLGERTVTVRHGADGNGSVQLGGQWVSDVESSWTPASLSVSAAVALPRILRPSVLRAAELTLGQACVLTIRAEEERYTHRVTYALGGASGTVVQETTQRELTWTPPLELARQLPRSVAGTMRLTVTTYDGDTTMGSSVTECRAYVPDTVRPTAALTTEVVNDGTAEESWGLCVQGVSRIRYAATAAAQGGASVRSVQFRFAGQELTGTTGTTAVIGISGTLRPTVTVTDSRGRSVTVTGEAVTVAAYYPPAITASMAARCAADGTEKDDGAYLKVKCAAQCADVQGHNTVVLRARFRPMGGAWNGYVTLLPGAEQLLGGGLDSGTSYEVELSAEDTVGNVRVVRYTAATSRVTLHLRAGGMGAAFGKYAEQEALECVWPAVFYGDVAVSGALTVNGQTVEAMLFPVGSVRLADSPAAPEIPAGAVWESVETGIAGVYGWRRTT